MDKKDFFRLHSELCKTISHPKRQEILSSLRNGEMAVNDLAEKTGMSQPNLSQHLALLRNKGVVFCRQEGNKIFYAIAHPKILLAFDLMSEVLQEILTSQNQTIQSVFNAEQLDKIQS